MSFIGSAAKAIAINVATKIAGKGEWGQVLKYKKGEWGQVLKYKKLFIIIYHMARPLRIEYPGAVYHITTRGNAKLKDKVANFVKTFFRLYIR